MALQDLKTMCSLLRSYIGEAAQKDFSDIELYTLISLAQFPVARRLLKINKSWFAAVTNLSVSNAEATLPTDCLEIEAIVSSDTINLGVFKPIPLADMRNMKNMLFRAENMNNDAYYVHVGTKVYFVIYSTTVVLPSSVILYYIQKPVEITEEDDETIIPVQFIDFILAHALWQCAYKAGLNPNEKRDAYIQMYADLVMGIKTDIQVASPGGKQ